MSFSPFPVGEGFIHVRRIAVTTHYTAPLADIRFCLYDLLDIEKQLAKLPCCESTSAIARVARSTSNPAR